MGHPLDGARLKLDRAQEHINAFGEESVPYLNSHFGRLDFQDNGEYRDVFFIVEQPPPLRLSAILGDCIHNIRASLDHLAWQLSSKRTVKTGFPIFFADGKYRKKAPAMLDGMPSKAVTLIEALQPYYGGKNPLDSPLWFVYELDNADKHKTLNLTQGRIIPASVTITTRHGPVAPVWISARMVHYGAKVASFRRADYAVDDYVKMDAEAETRITLDNPGPWGQEAVIILAAKALDYIRNRVLPIFEPFFGPTP